MKKIILISIFSVLLFINNKCIGQFLYLPSQPSWINIGDLDVTGDSLTVEAIVMLTNGPFSVNIVSKHTSPADVNYLLRPMSFEITTVNGYYWITNTYTLSPDIFYHVAATYDGQTARYYVNGCETGSLPVSGDMIQNDLITAIGDQSSNQTEQFYGYIDEVRIWNVTRTEQQLKDNMTNLPSPTTQQGLMAYYQFNGNYNNMQGNMLWDGTSVGSAQLQNNTAVLPEPFTVTIAPGDTTICSGTAVTLSVDSVNGFSYTWFPTSGLHYSTSTLVIANPTTTTTYTLTGKNSANCFSSSSVTINIEHCDTLYTPTLYSPNIFTPNGDGFNDLFLLKGVSIAEFQMRIFNRWGELVFQANNINQGWDGKYKNESVKDGVYSYVVTGKWTENTSFNRTGTVTLIK